MTNPIYAYGEDSMTLALLQNNNTLKGEGFEIDLTKAEIFYRPSFGRRYGFGEFDAIIATHEVIYLIESKWKRNGKRVKLEENQIERHRKFKKYYDEFTKSKDCAEFAKNLEKNISKKNQLYKNLEFVFGKIEKGKELINLLVVFNSGQEVTIVNESEIKFYEIMIALGDEDWFRLDSEDAFKLMNK